MFEHWKLANRCSITREFVGAYRVRDVISSQEAFKERHCRVGISVPLDKDVKHGSMLVDGSP